ncbi:hexose transporter Hxt14p [Monosporozyma unispora]|nr:general substrate transporter [Kazachstania unispora]
MMPSTIQEDVESILSSSSGKREINFVETSNVVHKKISLKLPIFLCLLISFGGFIFGWDVGTIGGIVNMKEFKNHFGTRYNSELNINEFPNLLTGLIIGIFNIGCAVGGIFLAKVGDNLGRKLGIALALIIYIIGVLVQVVKDNSWYQFVAGRTVCGLGVGANAVLVPMFISESAPIGIRGSMVVLFQVMVTFGILVGNITNYLCVRMIKDSDNIWKMPLGLGFIWAVLLLVGLIFVPESAEYLMIKKMNEHKARDSFAKMNGVEPNDNTADKFVQSMQAKLFVNTQETSQSRKWHEFATGRPKLGLRLSVGILLMAFQQLTGINYFFYYGTALFENAGMNNPYSAAIILSTVNFVATFAGIYLVESWGRKLSLLFGSVGMFLCMATYASIGSFALDKNGTVWGMIAVTCVYIIFFATTSGPVTFVIVSELFPIRTRAISIAICSATNWITNFFISLLIPIISAKINFFLGYIFALFLFISIFFIMFLVPETQGKSYNQIDSMYGASDSESTNVSGSEDY